LFHRDESRFAKGCSRLRVTAAGKALLDMLGVFAEFETNLRRERQPEGIALAETRGVSKGLKPSVEVAEVGRLRHEEKLVNGTTHRFSTPSQHRQCGDLVLRMFVTPGSDFLPA
jgi:hypothetical protein